MELSLAVVMIYKIRLGGQILVLPWMRQILNISKSYLESYWIKSVISKLRAQLDTTLIK